MGSKIPTYVGWAVIVWFVWSNFGGSISSVLGSVSGLAGGLVGAGGGTGGHYTTTPSQYDRNYFRP